MTRLYLLCGCLVIFSLSATAQFVWKNPLPQGNDLRSIWFTDPNNGYVGGESGTILKTSDGGTSWLNQNLTEISPYTKFVGISFPVPDTGYAVSRNGLTYRTINAGLTWDTVFDESYDYQNDIFFTDALHGVIACSGGYIFTTTDGGISWTTYQHPSESYLSSLWFPEPDTGYIAGDDGMILKTTNGGSSWVEIQTGFTTIFKDIMFSSTSTGLAVGYNGEVLRTTDGGITWTQTLLSDSVIIYSIGMFHPDTILLLGYSNSTLYPINYPFMARSTDGGVSWELLDHEWTVTFPLYVTALPGGTSYATGGIGMLVRSDDYGETWTYLSSMVSIIEGWGDGIRAIDFPDGETGYAVAGDRKSTVLKTIDGGDNWFQLDSVFSWINHLTAVEFTSPQRGYIGGVNLYSTFDGGNTWNCRYEGTWPKHIRSIAFNTPWTGIAVGLNGLFLRTHNTGQSWVPMTSVPGYDEYDYSCAFFLDDSVGYVGSDVMLLKTFDGGLTWTSLPHPWISDIYFTDRETGYGIMAFEVTKTTDGGLSWTPLNVPTNKPLLSVFFYDADTGFVSGGQHITSSLIFKTTDAGETWQEFRMPTIYPMEDIVVTENYNVFACGWYGTLFGAQNGAYTAIENLFGLIQDDILLVYPNPASGKVNIEFRENPTGFNLSILDLKGNAIFSTFIPPHQPKIQLNLFFLSSGVYLVKLTKDKIIYATEKLVLIR